MKKFSVKKKLKSNSLISSLFNYFSSVFATVFDEIEEIKNLKEQKPFKRVMLAFQGKSARQIKKQFETEKFVQEEKMRQQARKELGI